MTLDDLVKICHDAETAAYFKTRKGMSRAGIRAVVLALRDEIAPPSPLQDDTWEIKWPTEALMRLFNDILGDAGNEKAAGATNSNVVEGGRPIPATPAADFCEWVDDGNPRKRLRNSCGLQGANKSWAGMHWQCTACLKPIKFKEPSHD